MSEMEDEELLRRFIVDLEKMNPPWKTWGLRLTCGINIRRETGELIRMFRMWDERYWNVYVFYKNSVGIRYRDKAYNKLTLKEAVMHVQNYIRLINKKQNAQKHEAALEKISMLLYGRSRLNCIESNICVMCGSPAKEFRNELSKKEFTISGMCQKCQDKIFGS